MFTEFPFLIALAVGLTINVFDITCTLLFAAKPWEAELRRQGLEPRNTTPIYYIITNFIGGLLLTFVYGQFAQTLGAGAIAAIIASLLVWSLTRIYGGGHVVMGQMPIAIFLVMSTGLGIGYVAGGQLLALLLIHVQNLT
jgi:hypothetical protein